MRIKNLVLFGFVGITPLLRAGCASHTCLRIVGLHPAPQHKSHEQELHKKALQISCAGTVLPTPVLMLLAAQFPQAACALKTITAGNAACGAGHGCYNYHKMRQLVQEIEAEAQPLLAAPPQQKGYRTGSVYNPHKPTQ